MRSTQAVASAYGRQRVRAADRDLRRASRGLSSAANASVGTLERSGTDAHRTYTGPEVEH
jgi:hypothetical protein